MTEAWRFSLHGGHRPTFGDDSHSAEAVGTGLELARAHLLRHDLREVTTLQRGDDGVERVVVPLE